MKISEILLTISLPTLVKCIDILMCHRQLLKIRGETPLESNMKKTPAHKKHEVQVLRNITATAKETLSNECWNCRRRGHITAKSWLKAVKCETCGKLGHLSIYHQCAVEAEMKAHKKIKLKEKDEEQSVKVEHAVTEENDDKNSLWNLEPLKNGYTIWGG